ncbi:helix-turn-helix transcriptional regulator [Micromonospora sp. CA-263727]|uniref:helix-turn-helix transcriptional regulator n=1 Tax=Micromonospora sp. CA-263727 TaxID=3239967 RepID=UPI003D8A510F
MSDRFAGGIDDRHTSDRPVAWSRPTTPVVLIGREAPLAVFDEVVQEFVRGRGRSVWVDGEPGIGKTVFLAEALGRLDIMGSRLFEARNPDTVDFFPLRAFLDALRIHPTVTDPDRAEIADRLWGRGAGPDRSGGAVTAAAEMLILLVERLCAAGPVVLAIDDMQWADDATQAVWARLAEATRQMPLLLVAAARRIPRRAEIDRLRHQVSAAGGVDISLDPLDDEQVDRLVRQIASAPPGAGLRALVRRAGGNPLYVRELLGALMKGERVRLADDHTLEFADGDASAPRSLTAAITAGLGYLTGPTTRVLRAAAVLGVEFRLELLSVLTAESTMALSEAVEEAIAAGVLADTDEVTGFRHVLIHHALYESTPAATRHALHRQAARTLADGGEPAEDVVTHIQSAPGPVGDWVLDWLIRVAPSITTRAPQVAVELLRRVLAQADRGDPRRVVIESQLADGLFNLADYAEFHRVAMPLLIDAADPQVIGRLTWLRVYASMLDGLHQEALEIGRAALAGARLPASWRARTLALNAASLTVLGQFDESLAMARQAEREGEQAADRLAVGWALWSLARTTGIAKDDAVAVLEVVERGMAIAGDDPASTELRLLLGSTRATALWNLSRLAEARRALGTALALAERMGSPMRLAGLRTQAAEFNFLTGRWDDALPELDAVLGAVGPRNATRAMLAGIGALIAVHRGDDALLDRYLAAGTELAVDTAGFSENLRAARALIEERDGRPEEALALLLALLDPDGSGTFPNLTSHRCVLVAAVVRLAIGLGRRDTAEAAASACLAEATRRPEPSKLAAADHCRGLVDQDAAALLAAAEEYARAGRTHSRGEALEDAAEALARGQDLLRARTALFDALDIYANLDAHRDIRRAQARGRRFGVRRSARGARLRASTGWAALTRSEVTVARLAAAGRSNPEIAGELYLSRNTVQTHMSHILMKLGCRSRQEIARFAASFD